MKVLLILAVLMNVDDLLKTGECSSPRDQVLSITPSTEEQVVILKDITTKHDTVLWMPVSPQLIKADSLVHLFVSANSSETVKDLLQSNNVTHQVFLDDTKELIENYTKSVSSETRSSSAYYERYHSLEEIYDWINQTAQAYPNMVETIVIGKSVEERPLLALKLSGENRADKKAIWMDCGIHAREWISPAFCLWFVQHSLTTYKENHNKTHILDSMDIYVLPVMNPDGYKHIWDTHDVSWRKNRARFENSSCIGVDLNRNFDVKMNWCSEGQVSHDPCSDTYCGPSPASEPETRALSNFLRSHNDSLQIYFAIHSYSQMLLFPHVYTIDRVPNYDELNEMVKEAAEKIKSYSGRTYTYGAGAETIYVAPGSAEDLAYDLGIKYSFTFELQDRGQYGFYLPPSRITSACEEALIAVQTIAHRVSEITKPDSDQI